MNIKIYGNNNETQELLKKVNITLDELGLLDFINVEISQDEKLKENLGITKQPALIVEEESIEFIDTIFEGIIPNDEELKSMFISIIGGESGSCGTEGGCPVGCSC